MPVQLQQLTAARLFAAEYRHDFRQRWYADAQAHGSSATAAAHGAYRGLMHGLLVVHTNWALEGLVLVARLAVGDD